MFSVFLASWVWHYRGTRFCVASVNGISHADAWLFQYHPAGLAHSGEIESERGSRTRYSDDINQFLAVRTNAPGDQTSPLPKSRGRCANSRSQIPIACMNGFPPKAAGRR